MTVLFIVAGAAFVVGGFLAGVGIALVAHRGGGR